MDLRIKRVPDRQVALHLDTLRALDRATFRGDKPCEEASKHWWLAWAGTKPIGFLCVDASRGRVVRIERYGVLARYRGHRLGRRFLRVAEQFARRTGRRAVITYTLPTNSQSMNAMIAAGYRTYQPRVSLYDRDVVYWIRRVPRGKR